MKEEIKGFIFGSIQTIIGHPLDTLKTKSQFKSIKCIPNTLPSLYKGIYYPLLSTSFINSIIFSLNNSFYNHLINYLPNENKNNIFFYSGFFSGFFSSIITQPIEYFKINKQLNTLPPYSIKPLQSFNGLNATILRESFATSIYFGLYYNLTDKNTINLHPFFSGGISGCLSWFLTYPIDVIKTRVSIYPNKLSYLNSIKQLSLFKGVQFCLLRSFIVNGVGFTFYESF